MVAVKDPAVFDRPLYRIVEWYSRRRFGAVAEPAAAMGHNMRVLLTEFRQESNSFSPVTSDLSFWRRAWK